jgi:hypothetical protein
MMVNGRIIICMGRVFILGRMEENMMVNINRIRNMVTERTHGQMVGSKILT